MHPSIIYNPITCIGIDVEELKRPMEGPAAKVDIPSLTDVPCQKNLSDVTLVNETQPCSCGSSRPIISLTVPVAKLGYVIYFFC